MAKLYPKRTPWLFLLAPLLVYTCSVFVPIFMSLFYSFYSWNFVNQMQFVGLDNFKTLLGDANFWTAFTNNLKFVLINFVLQVVMGLFLSILIMQVTRRITNIVKILYFIPCIIASVAISETVKRMVTVTPQGVINALLEWIGLGQYQAAFAGDSRYSLIVVALTEVYRWSGLYMIVYYSAFISVPNEQVEAAIIDGANTFQIYRYVRLPMIKNIIGTTAILIANGNFKVFDTVFLITGGGPGFSSHVLSTYLYNQAFSQVKAGYGSAIALFQFLICILVVVLMQLLFRNSAKDSDV